MQFDEFDKKIKQAADDHHPLYDEKAWEKMEKLLDKNLPQKKEDRKRYIFFILLFLLTAGGLYLMIAKPGQAGKHVIANEESSKDVSNTVQTNPISSKNTSSKGGNENIVKDVHDRNTKAIPEKNINEPKEIGALFVITKKQDVPKIRAIVKTSKQFSFQKNKSVIDEIKDNMSFQNNKNQITEKVAVEDNNLKSSFLVKTAETKNDELQQANQKQPDDVVVKEDATEKQTDIVVPPPSKKIHLHNKKGGSFFFTISASPDVSFAAIDDLGKTKLLAGAGFGYTFKNNLTIRTGFYTARKVYSATPYQYHLSSAVYIPYYSLTGVKADCKIYEIPLLISYNFSHSKNQNWLATAGLSSYLMKKETYNYQYKSSYGQYYTHQSIFTNENKHYFSVLTLSAGYQRNINNTISIMAEPYMKVPLAGIGNGKVKLNSAGVLLSLGVKLKGSGKNK